ncbi:copper-binding transcription factor [Verticillium nonalfalfae]|uniref:Copper-binding transcription factor n=1 Tax=Verticillium nonalfalfae TaxID=1051616 RepID=A0A3M9YQD1_9PEZI|nr:copper-binding transcription factor [Verticillium nonalfalfae]RNJ61300.1 copper-binding transcription factor [Verticillium nonalfalfae]
MSCQNPRRRSPVTRVGDASSNGLTSLKTNMTLRKGATFHSPTSLDSSSIDAFIPPALGRSQTNLEDVVGAHVRRMEMIVSGIETSLNLNDTPRPASKPSRDECLPRTNGFLGRPTVDPAMAKDTKTSGERRVLRPRHRRSSEQHASDSGLGTSLASSVEKQAPSITSKTSKASAITRSAAAPSNTMTKVSGLSSKAVSRVHEHVLRPLRAKPELKDFEPIVLDIPRRIRDKEIICLRDLEKTLIFMAPVSQLLYQRSVWGDTYRSLMKERAKTAALYLDFCLTSIRCIQATVEYLSDREQTRPADRPYTNGYFIDLVEQIRQYAGQLATAKEAGVEGREMDVDPTDEVKLFGGISQNGRPAELVRVRKDGQAISMATGLPVDMDEDGKDFPRLKRSLSQQLADDEEIMRSMARRKKNATPEELAPKKCREPGCNKEFKRPCDLTKHEKTHSRPWKCPVKTCKYHEYGWPTEKEMDRHHNDKHSSAPPMHECLFKPCPYKSKRESNCKQHMEKAHGWQYVRTKTNGGKKAPSVAGSSAQPTPQLGNMATPSSSHSIATPPEESTSLFPPFNHDDFPHYVPAEEFADTCLGPMGQPPMTLEGIDFNDLGVSPTDYNTPSTDTSYPYTSYQDGPEFVINNDDIYGAHVQIPTPTWPEKMMAGMQNYVPVSACEPQMMPEQLAPHISPIGQGNAMLFTPNSLAEVDEGFDDFGGCGDDFTLFPVNGLDKDAQFQTLFGSEMPSSGLGLSQGASQDFFGNGMDWSSMDYHTYSQQPQHQQ